MFGELSLSSSSAFFNLQRLGSESSCLMTNLIFFPPDSTWVCRQFQQEGNPSWRRLAAEKPRCSWTGLLGQGRRWEMLLWCQGKDQATDSGLQTTASVLKQWRQHQHYSFLHLTSLCLKRLNLQTFLISLWCGGCDPFLGDRQLFQLCKKSLSCVHSQVAADKGNSES